VTILGTRTLPWPDEAACAATAAQLAARPAIGDAVVELHGALGAGKTTFARYLLRALGAVGRIKSPTYALVEPYELPRGDAWHLDFYRLDDPQEWEDAGLRDVFAAPGLKISEWPERARGLLPEPDLALHIEAGDDECRTVHAEAHSERGLELLP
jgi:tRNA threonylcarbamoyladenosine biosynthesis protein TsaE